IAENTKVYIYTSAYSTRYAKYLNEYVEIDVTASQITANKISQPFDFIMKPFRVSGRVFDPMAAAGSQGIAGVDILTSSDNATTDEDGFYQLLLFENKQPQKIYAWDNEMWDYALPQTTTDNYITIAANNTADKIDQNFIASRTPALIKGTVVSQKGVPVQGVQVFWSIGWKETETDADGRFEVKTFQELEGSVYVYSNWEQLAVSASATPKKGEITDIGEILVVSNMAPIMDSVRYTPPDPIAGQPLSVRVEARDPDNDHLTYSFTAKTADDTPIASLSDTTADSLEIASGDWPPGFNGGWIKIEISVSDHCETDPAITCETVTQSLDGFVKDNAPPIIRDVSGLISPYNQTTSSNMTLTVDAYDPEGSLLTYSAELYNSLGQLPTGWGSVVGTSTRDKGVITILNTIEDGDYSLRISVSDGSASRSTTRKFRADGNTAPGIQIVYLGTDTTADISNTTVSLRADGTPVSITVDAYDAQDVTGDLNIKWRLPAQFTGVSGTDSDTVMFTPAVGSFTAAVLVTDFGGLMASKTFDIDVKANRLPMVNLSETGWDITRLIKTADGTLKKPNGDTTTDITLTVIASDPEGDHLTFEFGDINTDLVSGVLDTNSATYSLSGLVPGRYAARYQVWDDAGAVADRTVTGFSIFEITLDRPPRLPEFFVPMKMKVSSNGNMLAVGEDPEGKALTFTWEAWEEAPGGTAVSITVDASDDTFSRVSFTAPSSQKSMFVRLTLSDGENSIYRERIVTVVSDRPPVISYTQVVPAVIKNSGKLFLFSEAYDEDDGLSNDPAPTWKIKKTDGSDATTDLFTGLSTGFGGVTVTKDATGDYNVWLEVVGGGQTVASSPVTVTIETANSSPSTPDLQINDKTLLPGETTSITASSSDPDGDEVSFEWRIDGVWQSDEVSDTITFSSDEPGDYTVAVQAYDGNTYSATSTDTITVQTLTLDLEAGPATIQQLGGEFTLTAAFSDGTPIPVDAATWTVTEAPAGSVAIISGSGASVAFTPDIAGPYTISLTVGLLGNAYTGEIAISTYTGPSLATIDGKVTDTLGNILSGARIRLYHQTDSSIYDQYATTDANGDYQFPGVPNGTYYLVVYAGNGFRTKTGVVTVGGPNEVDVKW
ncbi:MAG: PKD domain-containing protein, partial [Proteobacteria bacterium]|nr:PKD domain-containing protein [Pseudomonadota bacterium]